MFFIPTTWRRDAMVELMTSSQPMYYIIISMQATLSLISEKQDRDFWFTTLATLQPADFQNSIAGIFFQQIL